MANSTLLQLVTDAAGEMGAGIPSTVVGNQTTNVVQLLALANGVGNHLIREHQWQASTVEYRFTTVYYQYTAATTNGSTTISALSSTTGLTTSPTLFMVTGTGIPQDTYLVSVNAGASTAVLSNAATASGTVTLTFSQTKYAWPDDYDRLIERTEWDKSQHWEMVGPETAQQWQWLKSGFIATGPRARFRPLGGYFQVWPPLSTDDQLGFEYLSKYWIYATGSTTLSKARFSVDTDTCIFPDRLMVAGIKKAYYAAKGFAPQWDAEFDMQLNLAKAHDASSQTLSMAPRMTDQLITVANLPDSGYGS